MKDIKDFTPAELGKAMAKIGEPGYRAKQAFFWIYRRGIRDFNEMNNMPRPLIETLKKAYYISETAPYERLKSADGTEKFLFKLQDGHFIEAVLISAKDRKTLCLSTQVGCKFACSFCASGINGFKRNLSPSEIINQILYTRQGLGNKITNYVFMGMGEPLDNYENAVKAIMIMNEPEGMAIGARRITVSTCGIIPGIEKLKTLGLQVNLSISLHAASDKLRDTLMSVNKRYPLKKLIETCEGYREKRGQMLTIEYILIKGVNDGIRDIDGLARIARRLKAKVNLISYSAVPGLNFKAPKRADIEVFMKQIRGKGVSVTSRESKGKDIQAACGQLAGEVRLP